MPVAGLYCHASVFKDVSTVVSSVGREYSAFAIMIVYN